ncbi:hypothetical protein TKK_0010282 [Trichogramma kaykai]|uniref:HAT C-terminal dimerisation domain-containing protein n=1 Tax=Trichogramma kaykai TaxID=54128 RepID=A0ABD2WYU9_9HYME
MTISSLPINCLSYEEQVIICAKNKRIESNDNEIICGIDEAASENTPKCEESTADAIQPLLKKNYGMITSDFSYEISKYFSSSTINREGDVLEYWKNAADFFPLLHHIAINHQAILATTIPSERLFSRAGRIRSDSRNRSNADHLNMMLFLSSRDKNDWM